MTSAVILCPGPSLATVQRQDIAACAPRFVVAINRAILREDLPIDLWACLDEAEDLKYIYKDWSMSKRQLAPPLLTKTKRAQRWTDDGFVVEFQFPDQKEGYSNNLFDFEEDTINWGFYTILATLAYCYSRKVGKIHVFGADMVGTGYFNGPDNRKDRGEKRWEERWKRERDMIGFATDILRKHGTEVVFH